MKKIWVIPLFLSLILFAQTAEGGILSSLLGFFSPSINKVNAIVVKEENEVTETNSQNIDLLESVASVLSTTSSRSEMETTITEGSAVLPEVGPLGTAADLKDDQVPSDLISVYTVHPGDSIEMIAKMYNVSANTIRWANDLKKGAILKPGDNLVILPITGVQLTAKKGDTIKGLAKKYGGNFEEIVAYNDLDPAKGLIAGDTIIIPNGEESTIVSSTKPGQKLPGKYTGPSYAGYFMRPITGGRRSQGIHGHNAIDLACSVGTPVYAAASGQVILARASGWNGGYGSYVIISHSNGTQTLYAHLSSLTVGSGAKVGKGDTIGASGNTGRSTGSHLHFEVRGATNPF
ncbi:MAG: peptidoglycan DD-metalloendopeptidase family protein [Candidatus Paceibacterota bacterium]